MPPRLCDRRFGAITIFAVAGMFFAADTSACDGCACHGVSGQHSHEVQASAVTRDPRAASSAVRFIVVGDTQGNGENAGYDDIVPQLIDDIEARNPHFVVFPGDLVGTGSVSTLSSWNNLTKRFGNNRYMVPGNHDLPGRSATNENWQTIFNWLPNSQVVPNITTADPNDTIRGINKMDYYVDIAPNIRLISVTTDRDALPGESHTHSGGYEILGGEPTAIDWFQSVMTLESTKQKDHVFVMTHHSVTTQMSEVNSSIDLTEGTPTEWWKSIAGTHEHHDGATADALFTGHTHSYLPNRPDPDSHTAEVIVGTGGGSTIVGATPQRRVHGFMEVIVENGLVSTTFYGDSNGERDGWSFSESLDTFTISDNGMAPRGELALYQFEPNAPGGDSSISALSKNLNLNFNHGASVVDAVDRNGRVLSLDGNGFLDSKSLGDHHFQVLGDLRISLWVKAERELGNNGPLDNVLVAFGDVDGAPTQFSWQNMFNDEIANYAYILSYTEDGRLRMTWEYHDDPDADAVAKMMQLVSTEAVVNPNEWHEIEILRDADTLRLRFLVDGAQLGGDLTFTHLPTGAGGGSLYIGALPNTVEGNDDGIATFSGQLDDILISSESIALPEPGCLILFGAGSLTLLRRTMRRDEDFSTQHTAREWSCPRNLLHIECDFLDDVRRFKRSKR